MGAGLVIALAIGAVTGGLMLAIGAVGGYRVGRIDTSMEGQTVRTMAREKGQEVKQLEAQIAAVQRAVVEVIDDGTTPPRAKRYLQRALGLFTRRTRA